MPEKSDQYLLEYLKLGSLYSGTVDYHRFVTLDYNMESYVGITGVGIISGWIVEHVSNLQVQVLPGKGMIQDYAVESPYEFKQRSEMVIPEREVEVVVTDPDETPQEDLSTEGSPSERDAYISVIQDYDSTYNPVGPIENSYVKVVIPTVIDLFDDNDNYIYAKRSTTAKPYPELYDLEILIDNLGDEPKDSDYDNYDDYLVAKAAYDAQLQVILDYDFRYNSNNQFTVIEFVKSTSKISSTSHLLLSKVVTRSGTVQTIDVSEVDSLENMQSRIKGIAREVLKHHHHGGTRRFDPAKIKLETDIRNTALTGYSKQTLVGTYRTLSSNESSTSEGHKHTYYVDSNGDGYTVGIFGTQVNHFHKIDGYVVSINETTGEIIPDHNHTIPNVEYSVWDDDSDFNVYIDGEFFGDQSSSSITASPSKNEILIKQGVGSVYKTYTCEFRFSLSVDSLVFKTYSFTYRAPSVLYYMLKMQTDFFNEYGHLINVTVGDFSSNPFLFEEGSTGVIAGFDDLIDQCSIAETLLSEAGSRFTFTPNAARNLTVTVLEVATLGEDSGAVVTVEILGNTEVTGVINANNILYLNASKVVLGKFEIENIPFINHVGRIGEECIPSQQYIISNNGIKYDVSPSITDVLLGHSHNVYLDVDENGITQQVFVGEDPVYYVSTSNAASSSYFVYHLHGIKSNEVLPTTTEGLTLWRNDVTGGNANSVSHTHEMVIPKIGDPKTVYSIQEDKDGNMYAGTASGFFMIPNDDSHLFVINGERIYVLGSDLWTAFVEAGVKYEALTGLPLTITTDIYQDQIDDAEESLTNDGDSYMMYGSTSATLGKDEIMIKKVSSFEMPNFKYVSEKYPYEVKENELVIGVKYYLATDGSEVLDFDALDSSEEEDLIQVDIVQRHFNDVPIWSTTIREDYAPDPDAEPDGDVLGVAVEDLFVLGSDVMSRGRDVSDNFYKDWAAPNVPSYAGGLKKVIKDAGNNLWITTSRGLFVSRSHSNGRVMESVSIPGFTQDIGDIVESADNELLIVSASGVYKTINGGKDWTTLFTKPEGFKQIVRDFESGSWASRLYVVSNKRDIYLSTDQGVTWMLILVTPSGDTTDIFAFNGDLFIGQSDGLYKGNQEIWEKVFDSVPFSFKESYDLQSMYIGCHNEIYSTSNGSTFESVYKFYGNPLPVYYENSTPQYFGYAYSNRSNSFHFNDFKYITSDISTSVIVDCNKWMAVNGPWTRGSGYDIFVDDRLVVSTQDNIDKRGDAVEAFVVNPDEGTIDFGASSPLLTGVEIDDSAIHVSDSLGFAAGDRVAVKTDIVLPDPPEVPSEAGDIDQYIIDIETYADREEEIQEMFMYGNVVSVINNYIYLDERADKEIEIPATINKIPAVEGSTSLVVNVYDSPLSNYGRNTHEELEDSLSVFSDTRPYQLNNTYLSNLLQLTQAMRYVYPEINSEFKHTNFYDFHYSWTDGGEDPNIDDYIDVEKSDIYNQTFYSGEFSRNSAKSINRILVGYGNFSNTLIVATDIGLFWSKIESGMEANWFYVNSLRSSAYDIRILGDDTIFVATAQGLYSSQDMTTWTLDTSPSIYYPIKKLELRWVGRDTVSIPDHSVTFSNDSYTDPISGYLDSSSPLYGNIQDGRNIKVTGAGSLNGDYYVKAVTTSRITIEGGFSSISAPVIHSSTEIQMAAWWEQFDGEDYTGTADISNTMLAGGTDRISYKVGDGVWNEGEFGSDIPSFNVSDFLSLYNGTMLASAVGKYAIEQKNYIFKSTDIGATWSPLQTIEEVRGTVSKSTANTSGSTNLTVNYTYPSNYTYMDGILNLRSIAFFASGNAKAIYQGYVIWNRIDEDEDIITIFGQEIHDIQKVYGNLRFNVLPVSIKSLSQLDDLTILFGTDAGMYTDKKTTIGHDQVTGEISRIGTTGQIDVIDMTGKILSIYQSVSGNVQLSMTVDQTVSTNQLVGQTLYITDLDPIGVFEIISNTVKSVSEEIVVEINFVYNSLWSDYVNKRVVVAPNQSILSVSFDYDVLGKIFDGGTLYIISNENDNVGESYEIVSSTSDSITIGNGIVPRSTFYGADNSLNKSLVINQKISLIDATRSIYLYVTFGTDVKSNQFAGSNFALINSSSSASSIPMIVGSHTKDAVVIDAFESEFAAPLGFAVADRFAIRGNSFDKLEAFNAKKTSTESGHYHELDLNEVLIKGTIDTVSVASNGTTVDISDVSGWDASILDLDDTLLKGAKVRIYNPYVTGMAYETKINSATLYQINVETIRYNMWDETAYSENAISVGWRVEIEAEYYGYTSGITYDDFVTDIQSITENVIIGAIEIKVVDTSNMTSGDKIKIVDGFGSVETHYIATIDDVNTITMTAETNSAFFVSQSARVQVLRDSFSNNHTHIVRKNEIESIIVEDYNVKGYPSRHSHRCLPYLASVNDISVGSQLVAIGSDSIVYKGNPSASTWVKMTDLNWAIQGGEEIQSISSVASYSDKSIVGTTNGYMFSQFPKQGIVNLEKPSV